MVTSKQQEQFAEIQRKSLDTAMQLTQMSLENSQRIMALQVQTAKSLFEESVANARALTEVKDPQEAIELRTQFAQATAQKMFACARDIAQIATEAQTEFGKVVSQQFSGGSNEFMEAVQKMMSFNPAAQEAAKAAMNSLQQAMGNAQGAFDQFTKVASDALSSFAAPGSKAPAKRK